ncbi:hypothetical protein WJX74_005141 [Apatococcus lobatus]|uniref:Uncharacterized protein n=2 Tax=Apatococcus TaxID=904362 RepID=A0AAW1T5J4_9CHLO
MSHSPGLCDRSLLQSVPACRPFSGQKNNIPSPSGRRSQGAGKLAAQNPHTSGSQLPKTSATRKEPLEVVSRIAACVEMNAAVSRFETIAGRSAMVGVLVAALAEVLASSSEGLFGSWGADELNLLGGAGIGLLSCAVLLAASSKRRMGKRLTEAVLTSITALSGVKGGARQRSIDNAVDRVFEQVFSSHMIHHNFLEDDFI